MPAGTILSSRGCSARSRPAPHRRAGSASSTLRTIAQARKLYAGEDLGLDLANTVHALDSTTLDLCLSVFPWAHFRATKAAVKMHTAILHLTYPPP